MQRRVLASILATVLAASATTAHAQTRDILVASPSPTAGNFQVQLWTTTGAPNTFTAGPIVVSEVGTATAIEPADSADGRLFVSADVPQGTGTISVVFAVTSPFLSGPFPPFIPTPIAFATSQPDLITDIKFDASPAGNPGGGGSLLVVGRDTANGGNFLRRVQLGGGVTSVVYSSGAADVSVAVDPTTGDIHVVDDLGRLFTFSSILAQLNASTINPPIQATDLMWDNSPVRPDPLVVSGTDTVTNTRGMFRLTPGAAPTATAIALAIGFGTPHITVDSGGNGYAILDLQPGTGTRQPWQWDNATGALVPTNLPFNSYDAISWTGRAATGLIFAIPGTALINARLAQPPLVGDTALSFIFTPAGITLSAVGLMLSTGWTPSGPSFGPNGQLLVDSNAPGFTFLALPGAGPPSIVVPTSIQPGNDGMVVFAQFIGIDASTSNVVTSNAISMTIGQRPQD